MNQPVIFLSEGSKRVRGRDAQRINILIAKAVANAVKSTLGPKGMDKMIVDELGDVTISNDGATILDSMSIDHPAGKMMVDVAKTQETEVGDGTTTAVVIAGNLLHKAEKLLDDEIHPSVIIKGYRLAARKAKELYESISEKIDSKDKKMLENIAMTTMTGKAAEGSEVLSKIVVDAIMQVSEIENGVTTIDLDNVKVEKKKGASLDESQLVKGIVIDKEIVHSGMPKKIQGARIALIDSALEIESTEIDAKIQITNPDQLQDFLNQEEKMLKDMVSKVKESGANVLFCQKGIDDLAQHFLAKEGIAAIRRVKKSDMEALGKATGARIITRINDITKDELGNAQQVVTRKVAGDDMVFVEGCKNPKAVSILVRGGTDQVIDEADRAIDDALGSVSSAIRIGKVVYGGGSCEVDVAIKLRKYATSVGGREQLAIEAFADTLEIIPRTLAETAGMDPLDTIVALKSQHSNKDGATFGVDVFKAKIVDMKKEKIIEPLNVKTQAITSGTEAAEMILRIDDIVAGKSSGGGGPPAGMPPGMGGMPPMM